MAEQITSSGYYQNHYKFNGKELDNETGMYYYGARYYEPRLSVWMSVDPLAGKYSKWTPYNYCINNPIKIVDRDGMDIDPATEEKVTHLVDKNSKTYNDEFAQIYNKLKDDHSTVYSFNEKLKPWENKSGGKVYGNVTYDGTNENDQYKIGINYTTNTGTSGLSSSSPLFEETYHAGQFSDGKFGFFKLTGDAFGLDIFDEAEAKLFAAQNTPDNKYGLENKLLNAYNKSKSLNDVVDFVKKRPSLIEYNNIEQQKLNVIEWLDYSGNQNLMPYFDSNGRSTINGAIMRKPK